MTDQTADPMDLYIALDQNPAARAAFANLTPAQQRYYVEYVARGKTLPLRAKRIQKLLAMLTEPDDDAELL